MKGMDGAGGAPSGSEAILRTPIWISHRLQIALIAAAIVLLTLAVWRVPTILTIVIGAGALALILSFPVGWLSRRMLRGLAVLVTLLLLLGTIVLALAVLIPLLIDQLTQLIVAWPGIQDRLNLVLEEVTRGLQARGLLPGESADQAARLRRELGGWGQEIARNLLVGLLSLATGAVGLAVQVFAILVIAIYLLLDVGKLREAFVDLAPSRYHRDAAALWDTFADSMSRYLGGVVFVAAITGVISGVALWILGVPYAVLLGVWVAFTSFIPTFGTYLGVVPALPLALAQSPATLVLTILVYVIIQLVQDNVLTPRVQGQTAHVHPILVLLTVLWTGLAFGLLWSVLAVPALVVIRVLFDFFRVRLRVRPDEPYASL
jgi:predicted PurR-regulated permease PerM